MVVADADTDKILLTSEASEDEALEMIDADTEARAEDALEPTLSELIMLDNSELMDDEMADRTLEAAEAATPPVVVWVASVVLEAVVAARAEDPLELTVPEMTTLDESESVDVEAGV